MSKAAWRLRPELACLLALWVVGCQPTSDDDDTPAPPPTETSPSVVPGTEPATEGSGTDEPSQPGGGTDEPSQPGGGTDEPSQPGGGTDEPSQPGGGTDEPSQPGGGTDEPSQPGGGTDEPSPPQGTPSPSATLPEDTPTETGGTATPVEPSQTPPGDFDHDGCLNDIDAYPTDPSQCLDSDYDGVGDTVDNCVYVSNYYQYDLDGDQLGDVCDSDADADGYNSVQFGGTDCFDLDATVNPGAREVCDPYNMDEDCDGKADDTDNSVDPYSLVSYYEDVDQDGYGNILDTTATRSCDPPSYIYAPSHDDCDDREFAVNPGATEVCDSTRTDENCDGKADEGAGLTCISVDDGQLPFGIAYPPETLTDIVTVYNSSSYTLSLGTPTITGTNASMFAVSLPRTTIPVGGSINVVVDYIPTGYGSHTAILTLPNDRFSTSPQVYLSGEGEKALVATPSPLVYPLTEVGKVSTTPLTLTNTSDLVLELSSENYSTSGPQKSNFFVSWLPPTDVLAPGESTELSVTFAPTQAGVATAALTISTTSGHTDVVDLSGEGFVANGSTPVMISQFRTRGPAGGSDEFVELYNNTDQTIDLYGWEIWGSSDTGGKGKRYEFFSGRQIAARSFLLLTYSSGGSYSGTVPYDGSYSSGFSDGGGLAILNALNEVVDQVGMSLGSAYLEGSPLTPMTNNSDKSYIRIPAPGTGRPTDSNNNAADFVVSTPSTPRNSTTPPL